MRDRHFSADGFTVLLRRNILQQKQAEVDSLATAIRVSSRTFYARLRNGSRFDPEEVSIVLRNVPDRLLAKWFFANSRLVLVNRLNTGETFPTTALLSQALTSAEMCVDALIDIVDGIREAPFGIGSKIGGRIRDAQAELLHLKLILGFELKRKTVAVSESDFAALLRRVLFRERDTNLQDLAAALGLSYHNLYARVTGRVAFSPADLRKLFDHYPEPDLADYLLAGTPFTVMLLPAPEHWGVTLSPVRAGMLTLREILKAVENLQILAKLPAAKETVGKCLDSALLGLEMMRWNATYVGQRRPGATAQAGSAVHGACADPDIIRFPSGLA